MADVGYWSDLDHSYTELTVAHVTGSQFYGLGNSIPVAAPKKYNLKQIN